MQQYFHQHQLKRKLQKNTVCLRKGTSQINSQNEFGCFSVYVHNTRTKKSHMCKHKHFGKSSLPNIPRMNHWEILMGLDWTFLPSKRLPLHRLQELCSLPNTCVVYPSPESLTVEEFQRTLCATTPIEKQVSWVTSVAAMDAQPFACSLPSAANASCTTNDNRSPPCYFHRCFNPQRTS